MEFITQRPNLCNPEFLQYGLWLFYTVYISIFSTLIISTYSVQEQKTTSYTLHKSHDLNYNCVKTFECHTLNTNKQSINECQFYDLGRFVYPVESIFTTQVCLSSLLVNDDTCTKLVYKLLLQL